jgi:hypothetical protein
LSKNTKRPDITWPSPDPTKEPKLPDFKVGDRIQVKSGIFFEGVDLTHKEGYIQDVSSYILVRLAIPTEEMDPDSGESSSVLKYNTIKMLRYEIELMPQAELWIAEKL